MQPKAVPFAIEVQKTPTGSTSFNEMEKALFEKRLANLTQQYEAVFNQRELCLSEKDKLVLASQLEHLKTQIQQTQSELDQL